MIKIDDIVRVKEDADLSEYDKECGIKSGLIGRVAEIDYYDNTILTVLLEFENCTIKGHSRNLNKDENGKLSENYWWLPPDCIEKVKEDE